MQAKASARSVRLSAQKARPVADLVRGKPVEKALNILNFTQKKASAPIVNEARGGLSNLRGTIAMARTSDPHSATCQFFINTVDNDFLDARNARDGWGYTVFGRVIKGMDVVDKISAQPTATRYGMRDVPKKTVLIEKVVIKR